MRATPARASLYKPRAAFANFHGRQQRWSALVCHRRAGKTVAGVNEVIERALYTPKPDARYLYVAPFRQQAKDVAWDYLLRFSEPFRTKHNIAELSVDLVNGARARLGGADNPDSLRGPYYDGVVLDEIAQMKPSTWSKVIRPALADRQGWAIFMGTPAGKNEFYDIYQRALKNPQTWFSMLLKASESGILPQSELDAARLDMDEDEYNQEFECSFDAAIRGSYYGKLINTMGPRLGHWPYTPGFRVHTCWDLGFTDDTVIWLFQVIQNRPVFFDLIGDSGLEISDYFDLLHEKRRHYEFTLGEFYLPHDAKAKSLQTGRSIQDHFIKVQAQGRIVPDLSVQDGINATRKLLAHCCIDETACAVGVEGLRQYQREWDEDRKAFRQKPRHDWTSHYADAMRMGAIGWREDYQAPQIFVPPQYRQKPLLADGVTLNEMWKTLPSHTQRARI